MSSWVKYIVLRFILVFTVLGLSACMKSTSTSSSCIACGGDGIVQGFIWDSSCSRCAGTGTISSSGTGIDWFATIALVVVLGIGAFLILSWIDSFAKKSELDNANHLRVAGSGKVSGHLPGEGHVLADGQNGYLDEDKDEDERMKVFVIGPEGAGKTVFLAALSRYIEDRSDELVFEPDNLASSNYVAGVLESLECRKWPLSNPQGQLEVLRWQFGSIDDETHEINLFDYSGQDMRGVLLEDDVEKLQGRPRKLREKIDDSCLLIYLLDMDGLIGGGSVLETNENSWLLKTFLSRREWCDKRRILVVTKSDLYADMINEVDGDLRKMILEHRPKGSSESMFRSQLNQIECFAVTSVKTNTVLAKDGLDLLREPRVPLESEGFEPLVDAILSELEDH